MRYFRVYIIVFVFIYATLWSQEKVSVSTFNPLAKSMHFTSGGKDTVLVLQHHFLFQGSVKVLSDSVLLKENTDYIVDFLRGEIFFKQIPDSGRKITVAYQYLPFQIPIEYSHYAASDTIISADSLKHEVSRIRSVTRKVESSFGDRLQKSGSIFRGISLGTNQGMRLQSGLRLQVAGKIAPKVEVVASLTDQNTPIQPEGNTQTLQEIDKVYVKVKAPGFRVTLGDYVFDVKGTDFGSYSRKLQGAMGTGESRMGYLTLSAAASKGEFNTNYFMGQEGNQGPYQLTGAKGEREIIVLAGTERVWVDGERLTRGEENDYTIEYGNGQIIFTRNRLVTGDSRITVDFEYSDQKFQKEIYGVVGEIRILNERIKLKTSFLSEADNKDHPLDFSLTDEYRQILQEAGDQPDSALYSGVHYLGENQGTYIRVDSAEVVFYRYVGSSNGDYTVIFSYVGQGNGDYNFQGYGQYSYEGPGQGSYLPVIFIPVATSHKMIDFASSIDIGKGMFLEGEIAVSDQDLNSYSSKDDRDNYDVAYKGAFRLENRSIRIKGKNLGELGFDCRFRNVGSGFRSVGRMTEVEHGRKWGTEEGITWGENIWELKGTYSPLKYWQIEGEIGSFRQGESFRSNRKQFMTRLSQPKIPLMQYQAELIESEKGEGIEGYWLRHQGMIQGRVWGFIPTVRYQGENRRNEDTDSLLTGFKYDEWTINLAFDKGFFRGEFGETIRDDRRYSEGILKKNSLARTDRFQCNIRLGQSFSTSLMYTHRNRDYTDFSTEDQKSDLADVKFRISPKNRFLDGTIHYRFSSTQISEMVRDTVRVGEGLGNYRYDEDLDELIPDPDGDILLRNIQTGRFSPINELKMGGEIKLNGARLWRKEKGFLGFLGKWRTRSLIRIERGDKGRDFRQVNRSAFSPEWGKDTTTVNGLISFHQDLEYTHPGAGFSLRLRYRKDDSENHQLMQQGIIRHLVEQGIRIKGNPVKKFGLLFDMKIRNESKDYTERPWSNRDIMTQELSLETSYRPKQQIEIAFKAKIKLAKDRFPDPATEATSIFLIPRFGYSFRGKGHLRAELEWGEVKSNPSDRTLPYEMLGGDQPGRTIRWSVLLTYRFTGHVMATMNYRGRHEPWRERIYQTGQVEVRAFF